MKCNSSLKNRLWAAPPQLPKSTTLKQVKFIHRDPHFYTCKAQVTQAIHLRLHPHNINRESRTEISEVWMLTIKKHNSWRAMQQRTTEGTWSERCTNHGCGIPSNHSWTVSFICFSLLGTLSHRKSPRLILIETDALLSGLKINH